MMRVHSSGLGFPALCRSPVQAFPRTLFSSPISLPPVPSVGMPQTDGLGSTASSARGHADSHFKHSALNRREACLCTWKATCLTIGGFESTEEDFVWQLPVVLDLVTVPADRSYLYRGLEVLIPTLRVMRGSGGLEMKQDTGRPDTGMPVSCWIEQVNQAGPSVPPDYPRRLVLTVIIETCIMESTHWI